MSFLGVQNSDLLGKPGPPSQPRTVRGKVREFENSDRSPISKKGVLGLLPTILEKWLGGAPPRLVSFLQGGELAGYTGILVVHASHILGKCDFIYNNFQLLPLKKGAKNFFGRLRRPKGALQGNQFIYRYLSEVHVPKKRVP